MTLLTPQLWPEDTWQSLSRDLDALDSATQRQLADAVSEHVIQRVLGGSPEATELLNADSSDERLEAIPQAFDEQGWAAQEADNEEGYAAAFHKARATNAAIAARGGDADEALADTLYEARFALDDDSALTAFIAELRQAS
jgi:hypothetical protein